MRNAAAAHAPPEVPRIAISYRRSDSAAVAGRLFDRLAAHFGRDAVFLDVDAIPPGVDFRTYIDGVLRDADVLLAVIGAAWLGRRADGSVRLAEPDDPVRLEIETALANGLTVVPVLVDGAQMPAPADLPASFGAFSYINAAPVAVGRDFHDHVDRLIRALEGGRQRPAAAPAPVTNLPANLSELIGRADELREIAALLEAARLVTLIGSGGVGKTRTALEIAAGVARDGSEAWFVDLAPLADPQHVPGAIAALFGIVDHGTEPLIDAVGAALKARRVLLVLDNCEHVLAAASDAATRLLRGCPDLRILATSREPLGIAGEEGYRMPSLPVPPQDDVPSAERLMQYGAAALFVARARAANRAFALTDENAPLVADIVRRLDGIALAIELAAPRVKVLSLRELQRRLDERFKLLTGSDRTALPRHQTLRALIGWSYELLGEADRRLLRRCAIFRGAWTLEAAEAICRDDDAPEWDALDRLAALVDKSLVVAEIDDENQRYRLLESTRAFALERLAEAGERTPAAARHARYFAELAQAAHEVVWQTDPDRWTAGVRPDLENYRAAIDWGLGEGGDAVAAATVVGSLRWLWNGVASERREGRALVERADAGLPPDAPDRVRGLLKLAKALPSSPTAADDAAAAVHALAGVDAIARVEALVQHALLCGIAGRVAAAVALFDEAVAAARSTRSARLIGFSLSAAAYWVGASGDTARAQQLFDEGATVLRSCNDLRELAFLEVNRAEFLFGKGDAAGALAAARRAQTLQHGRGRSDVLALNVAAYLIALERFDEAWTVARECLDIALRADDPRACVIATSHLAHVAAAGGDPERAVLLVGHTDAAYRGLGYAREGNEQLSYDWVLERARATLPADRLATLLASGEALDRDTAYAEALAVARPAPAVIP